MDYEPTTGNTSLLVPKAINFDWDIKHEATVNYILTNAGNDSITSNNISFNVVLACDQSLTPPSIMFNAKNFLQMLDLNKNLQITTLKITGGAYR